MKRREFIQVGAVGTVAGAVLPLRLLADTSAGVESPLAGGVYYTRENPGRWAKKVGGHLPLLEKTAATEEAVTIAVTTDHVMNGYKHYIVKHMLLDKDFQFVGEKIFDPDEDEPVSQYSLPADYQGLVYALSMCNKHDVWLDGITV